jgi:hypothetical protein
MQTFFSTVPFHNRHLSWINTLNKSFICPCMDSLSNKNKLSLSFLSYKDWFKFQKVFVNIKEIKYLHWGFHQVCLEWLFLLPFSTQILLSFYTSCIVKTKIKSKGAYKKKATTKDSWGHFNFTNTRFPFRDFTISTSRIHDFNFMDTRFQLHKFKISTQIKHLIVHTNWNYIYLFIVNLYTSIPYVESVNSRS